MRLPPTGAAPWTLRIPSGTSSILLAIFDSPHLCRTKGPRVEAGLESGPMRVVAKRARNNPGPNPRPTPGERKLALQYSLMIALLRGVLLEKHPNQAVVDVGGVGYDVTIPVSTYAHLPDAGAEVRLRIHTHVREDVLALYGFLTQDEKHPNQAVVDVGGVGYDVTIPVSTYAHL